MPYDKDAAADYAYDHAAPNSVGRCARYVRTAIEQGGGLSLRRTEAAKDYGPILVAAGFFQVSGPPQKGDVIVIDAVPNYHPYGHMAIFHGDIWVSDFRQRPGAQGFYPGPRYREHQPKYKLYRHL